jgi:small subunit ribosomal protein S13
MIRVLGIILNDKKKISLALTDIYGIGLSLSHLILKELNINPNIKTNEIELEKLVSIIKLIETKNYKIENDLKRSINLNIKRLIDLKTYRGFRHRRGLPVNGQRTRTNAKTSKRNTIFIKKKL